LTAVLAAAAEPSAVEAYVVVALIGAVVGAGEIIVRYKDNPVGALCSRPALAYVGLNVASTLAALFFIRAFNAAFGVSGDAKKAWTQILVGGFGATTFFRSAIFLTRHGDTNIGPSALLEAGLAVADRGIDRRRAKARAAVARDLPRMAFEDVHLELVSYCFALMQNVGQEEQAEFARDTVTPLRMSPVNDMAKARALALALMNIVGEDVLVDAVKTVTEPRAAEAAKAKGGAGGAAADAGGEGPLAPAAP